MNTLTDGFKGGSYKPFEVPLPPEIAAKIGDERPTIHIITGPSGMCLCGVYGEKQFICDEAIKVHISTLVRRNAELLKIAQGLADALRKIKLVADRVDDAGGSTWQCGLIAESALAEFDKLNATSPTKSQS